jgi:DNA repair protein RadD
MKLRAYQEQIVQDTRTLMKAGNRAILICSPTGSGKTALTAYMLGSAASKGQAAWFIVHRRELVKQSTAAFDKANVRHGIIANGFIEDHEPLIQICSVGTLRSRAGKMTPPKLIVWDECHHLGAAGWKKIFNEFPNAYHIGLTATPARLDGKGLDDFFSHIVRGPSVRTLIDDGYLSDYKLYAPAGPSLAGIHTRMGDFVKSELLQVMDKPTITGSAIKEYQRRAHGKRAVVFCVSIEHSQHVVEQFKSHGIPAEHVDGETDRFQRDQAIERFRRGDTLVLTNVDLFGEGFDLPAIECAILLRPTQSLGLYLQQVGRALRPVPGKTHAIILDHANNAATHGLPCENREWSLQGIERRTKKQDAQQSIKICASCFAAQLPGSTLCKFCGYAFPAKPRVIDEVDGDLVEIDTSTIKQARRQEQGMAASLSELIAIGKQRGYRKPEWWAKQVFNSRQRKKLGMGNV